MRRYTNCSFSIIALATAELSTSLFHLLVSVYLEVCNLKTQRCTQLFNYLQLTIQHASIVCNSSIALCHKIIHTVHGTVLSINNFISLTAPTQPVTDPILNESSATMVDQLSVCPDISLFDPDSYRDRECEDYNLQLVSNLDFIRFCMISGNTSGRDRRDQLSGVFFF